MININLTKEEADLILEKRREKKENEPTKVGYAKFDLYAYPTVRSCDLEFREENDANFWLADKGQVEKWKESFNSQFAVVIPKGTKFVCYSIRGTHGLRDEWFDDINYGLECMDAKWAEKYLENITDL